MAGDGASEHGGHRPSWPATEYARNDMGSFVLELEPDKTCVRTGSTSATRAQMRVAKVTQSVAFNLFVGFVIFVNVGMGIHDTNVRATGDSTPGWFRICSQLFLVFFSAEVLARIFVQRWRFFASNFNSLDLGIVLGDVVMEALSVLIGDVPSITIFRVARAFRIARFLGLARSNKAFRELYMIIHGFFSAMKAIFWASILLGVMLLLWSIIAVEVIRPINEDVSNEGIYDGCERCGRAFSSVEQSCMTFVQQIVAGDSWGLVTVPIIERRPWTAIFFAAVLISVNLGMMNLILSVIVDKAQEARADDHAFLLSQRQHEFESSKRDLLKICRQLDADDSGCLSLDELMNGFDDFPQFAQAMQVMHVTKDDLPFFYTVLDMDGSGNLDYNEFIEQLHKVKAQDSQVLLVLLKAQVTQVNHSLSKMSEDTNEELGKLRASIEEISMHRAGPNVQTQPLDTTREDGGPAPMKAQEKKDTGGVGFVQEQQVLQQDGSSIARQVERELLCFREQVVTDMDVLFARVVKSSFSQGSAIAQQNDRLQIASEAKEDTFDPSNSSAWLLEPQAKDVSSAVNNEGVPRPKNSSRRRQPEGCKMPACCSVKQGAPGTAVLVSMDPPQ